MLLEVKEKQVAAGTYHPPQAVWSPEMEMLAKIADQVSLLRVTFIAANQDKKKPPPKWEAVARPVSTGAEEAKWARIRQAHDRVVGMLQPNKGTIPEEGLPVPGADTSSSVT